MKLAKCLKGVALLLAMLLCIPWANSNVRADSSPSDSSSSSSSYSSSPVSETVVARENKAADTARTTTQIITSRIMSVFSPKPSKQNLVAGLSSGDAFEEQGLGLWGLGAYSDTGVNKSGYQSTNTLGLGMFGLDTLLLDDKLALGVAAGYENTWSKTKLTGYTENGNGYSISPYAAYRVNDAFTLKGILNTAFSDYDVNQNNQNYSGVRLTGDISGEYAWVYENLTMALEAGFMYMNEDFNHNYEDTYLGEGRVSGRIGYGFENGVEPYFRGTYYQNLINNNRAHLEDHLWEGALGLNYYIGSFAISAEGFGLTNVDKDTLGGSLLVRFDF
ncbi:autotransporter domain-containing protein [Maridesulfovibrio ferrireducens]|uniref:autotransporter domain-containing protein n=1 Tax=Maridesulfovibrio ferrireducens TaxID=246191 RepID=UPI001A328D8F|nr:autotransporter domain-containing protein [Maridesulfovibrio ferrireducens]MBI9113325.1 autotransporter domain-containing protein [Maridesulfovibrio ferrireducens]